MHLHAQYIPTYTHIVGKIEIKLLDCGVEQCTIELSNDCLLSGAYPSGDEGMWVHSP